MNFTDKVENVLNNIRELLITKNEKYGNSALQPKRIFSKADSIEQLLVRLDDKLSRIVNIENKLSDAYLDAVCDLIGYLVLLLIALYNSKENLHIDKIEKA